MRRSVKPPLTNCFAWAAPPPNPCFGNGLPILNFAPWRRVKERCSPSASPFIRETFEAIRARFGQPKLADVPADHDVLEFELVFAHGVRLDILTARTSGGEGPIAKFLARFGEGIQQVECDVRDAQRAAEILQRRFALEPLIRKFARAPTKRE